jgi:hypothetical protein
MPTLEQIRGLAEGMGWIEILPQNNPRMISFKDEEFENYRINIYFTTMSVTVQSKKKWGIIENLKQVSLTALEKLFLITVSLSKD